MELTDKIIIHFIFSIQLVHLLSIGCNMLEIVSVDLCCDVLDNLACSLVPEPHHT